MRLPAWPVHDIRFDIQIVDGVVGGTGWSDRLTKVVSRKGGMSVVLSACVAGHLASSQPRYVNAIIGLITVIYRL